MCILSMPKKVNGARACAVQRVCAFIEWTSVREIYEIKCEFNEQQNYNNKYQEFWSTIRKVKAGDYESEDNFRKAQL